MPAEPGIRCGLARRPPSPLCPPLAAASTRLTVRPPTAMAGGGTSVERDRTRCRCTVFTRSTRVGQRHGGLGDLCPGDVRYPGGGGLSTAARGAAGDGAVAGGAVVRRG